MKALVLSDTHGMMEEVSAVCARHQSEVDAIFHCGDSELPSSSSVLKEMYVVLGNCDFDKKFPEERLEEINGVRIYVTHGHKYNVKMSYVPLTYRGEEKEADFVFFGHSHVPVAFQENGIVYVNPGSLLIPRSRSECSYAIVHATKEKVTVQFFERDSGKELTDLRETFERQT